MRTNELMLYKNMEHGRILKNMPVCSITSLPACLLSSLKYLMTDLFLFL